MVRHVVRTTHALPLLRAGPALGSCILIRCGETGRDMDVVGKYSVVGKFNCAKIDQEVETRSGVLP